jgi:protein gp37
MLARSCLLRHANIQSRGVPPRSGRRREIPVRDSHDFARTTDSTSLGPIKILINSRCTILCVRYKLGKGSGMALGSSIEWTDATWNPVRGCTKVSAGCAHCYAETLAERFRGVPGHPYEQGFDLRLVPEKLAEPLRWGKPSLVFVNSMSDLFHEDVPDDYIVAVARVMQRANWHHFQVLTKRSERMRHLLRTKLRFVERLAHIWWGVSVENRKQGLPRIDDLRMTGAAVRFLSIEPLLEDLGSVNLSGIGWVIVGGESGAGARPMQREWVVSIRDQCKNARVPFFFKQWGGVRKSEAGRELDGTTYDCLPKTTSAQVPPPSTRRAAAEEVEMLYKQGLSHVRIRRARAIAG